MRKELEAKARNYTLHPQLPSGPSVGRTRGTDEPDSLDHRESESVAYPRRLSVSFEPKTSSPETVGSYYDGGEMDKTLTDIERIMSSLK